MDVVVVSCNPSLKYTRGEWVDICAPLLFEIIGLRSVALRMLLVTTRSYSGRPIDISDLESPRVGKSRGLQRPVYKKYLIILATYLNYLFIYYHFTIYVCSILKR